MLPLERRKIEPLAASVAPDHGSVRPQSQRLLAQSGLPDEAINGGVCLLAVPRMDIPDGVY